MIAELVGDCEHKGGDMLFIEPDSSWLKALYLLLQELLKYRVPDGSESIFVIFLRKYPEGTCLVIEEDLPFEREPDAEARRDGPSNWGSWICGICTKQQSDDEWDITPSSSHDFYAKDFFANRASGFRERWEKVVQSLPGNHIQGPVPLNKIRDDIVQMSTSYFEISLQDYHGLT